MAEQILTTDASGTVQHSEQPKAKPKAGSSSSKAKPPSRSAITKAVRGVPGTVWDNPDNDPNKRVDAGEDPEGERNTLKKVPGEK